MLICRLINWHVRQLLRKKLGYHLVTFANETIVSSDGADASTDSNSTTRWAQGSQSADYTINRCKHKANSSALVRGNLILCLWRLICACSFILASWQLKAWWALSFFMIMGSHFLWFRKQAKIIFRNDLNLGIFLMIVNLTLSTLFNQLLNVFR